MPMELNCLDAADIRYSSDSIASRFATGESVQCSDASVLDNFEPISVFWDGLLQAYRSRDNRRLFVAKNNGCVVTVCRAEKSSIRTEFITNHDGLHVYVRRDAGIRYNPYRRFIKYAGPRWFRQLDFTTTPCPAGLFNASSLLVQSAFVDVVSVCPQAALVSTLYA